MHESPEMVNNVVGGETRAATGELAGWARATMEDPLFHIRHMGEMIELYLRQLALGWIGRDEFERLVRDLTDVKVIRETVIGMDARERAERIAGEFRRLVLEGSFKLLKS